MSPPLDVAVIVPCIAVDPLLERCVATCHELYPDVEVVALLDDATGSERIAPFATVVEVGPISLGAKRNVGVARTSTAHVAFLDSDAHPEPGWLEAALTHLDADGGATLAAVGGPNVSPEDAPLDQLCVGRAHLSPLVTGWWTYRKQRAAAARDVPHLPTCNLVFRREDYLAAGGMDEGLFTAEDTDLCRRVTTTGRRIRFEPDVVVVHKDRGLRAFAVQRYVFGIAMVPLTTRAAVPDRAYTAVAAAPVIAVLGLASAPLALLAPRWGRWWRRAVTAYGLVVAAEAVRVSRRPAEVPGTAAAIAVGNLAPGVGVIVGTLGGETDLRGIYRNDG